MWQSEGDHVSTEAATSNFCLLCVRLNSEKNTLQWFSHSHLHDIFFFETHLYLGFMTAADEVPLSLSPVSDPSHRKREKRKEVKCNYTLFSHIASNAIQIESKATRVIRCLLDSLRVRLLCCDHFFPTSSNREFVAQQWAPVQWQHLDFCSSSSLCKVLYSLWRQFCATGIFLQPVTFSPTCEDPACPSLMSFLFWNDLAT